MSHKFKSLLLCITLFIAGVLAANAYVNRLQLSLSTDRDYFVHQISQPFKPINHQTAVMQNFIYQTRVKILKNKTTTIQRKTKSVQQYIEPLELELNQYRTAFTEKTITSKDERLQLYIDLVSKYRDYQRALSSLDTYVPLKHSDSLLSAPSVQLDLVYRTGGDLASTHNRFLDEPRDSSFATAFEPNLRNFLQQFNLNSLLVECHEKTCAVHMSHIWADEYYRKSVV